MMFKTLILLENAHLKDSLGLLGAAKKLRAEGLVYGLSLNLAEENEVLGLDYLIEIKEPSLHYYDSRGVAQLVRQVQETYQFDSILVLATSLGRMIAPRIAMSLKTGLIADITGIEARQDEIYMIRPAFSGNVLAHISCETKPMMASVHPQVFEAPECFDEPKRVAFSFGARTSTIKVEQVIKKKGPKPIQESPVLIAFGGGFTGDIAEVNGLADRLQGAVASSKKPVDAGLAPRSNQVGQSGKTVSPSLYLALGISGAIHHVEGLKNVETLISVNTNQAAALNYLADIVIVGDAMAFLTKLKNRMEEG